MNQVIINVQNGKMTVTLDEPKAKKPVFVDVIMAEWMSQPNYMYLTTADFLRWLIETGRIKEDA